MQFTKALTAFLFAAWAVASPAPVAEPIPDALPDALPEADIEARQVVTKGWLYGSWSYAGAVYAMTGALSPTCNSLQNTQYDNWASSVKVATGYTCCFWDTYNCSPTPTSPAAPPASTWPSTWAQPAWPPTPNKWPICIKGYKEMPNLGWWDNKISSYKCWKQS